MAETRAASEALSFLMIFASVSSASRVYCRAALATSTMVFVRPPGFPDWPGLNACLGTLPFWNLAIVVSVV
jgi:hypothetical protein